MEISSVILRKIFFYSIIIAPSLFIALGLNLTRFLVFKFIYWLVIIALVSLTIFTIFKAGQKGAGDYAGLLAYVYIFFLIYHVAINFLVKLIIWIIAQLP